MITIWKYSLPVTADLQSVTLPEHSNIVRVGAQGPYVCLWALVDTASPTMTRQFVVLGTGQPIPNHHYRYVGSCDLGEFVWHVFERLT